MTSALGPDRIAEAFIAACRAELAALKPGNVHVYAAGHRMQVEDFERSAEAAAPHIANPRLRVGARIRRAVDATMDRVGCNTNLGIVLLCAPLAAASSRKGGTLRGHLADVLAGLDHTDASNAFAAISRANPAGLGTAKTADVAGPAEVTLREAMALAARRDRIARAYVTEYKDVFGFGLSRLAAARAAGASAEDAITALHMDFLGAFADSHIARKHGAKAAREVQAAARDRAALARPPIGPAARRVLLAFDRELKAKNLNPGTTADFVVATLFAESLNAERAARRAR